MSRAEDPPVVPFSNLLPMQVWQAVKIMANNSEWVAQQVDQLGSTVFRAHPGWDAYFVCDHDAASQVLNAPSDEVDRDEGFLCFTSDFEGLLFGSRPALHHRNHVTSDHHQAIRQFFFDIMDKRGLRSFLDICQNFMDNELDGYRKRSRLEIEETLAEISTKLLCRWLLGFDGFDGADVCAWVQGIFVPRGDNAVFDFLLSKVKPPEGEEGIARSKRMFDAIRAAPLFPDCVQTAKAAGVPEQDVAADLAFSILLNGTAPVLTVGKPTIANIFLKPAVRASVEAEVSGVTTAHHLAQLPLLDGVFLEGMRLYGQPKRAPRFALKDLELTASDGRIYRIPKGSSVHVVNSLARADPKYFSDPRDFDPARFVKDPSLKDRIFAFTGPVTKELTTGFYCPAARKGVAPLHWKVAVLTFLKDPRSGIVQEYVLDKDALSHGTVPGSLEWAPEGVERAPTRKGKMRCC